jgi:hypothetical protein
MAKYVKYVHPRYEWYNLVLKELGEGVYLTPNGDIKYTKDILIHTKEDENEAKPDLIYGIIEDDGSFEIEFRNKLYSSIVEAEHDICSSKIKIARLKELGGIQ